MQILTIEFQILIILLQLRHLTVTISPGKRSNLFEPHIGHLGQALTGSIKCHRF
ncbi:MAG: hypothetical protein SCG72_00590 [Nitrosarchaeum sp.]|nr:hypothetical protein [Nitrosarchaeum sp.]